MWPFTGYNKSEAKNNDPVIAGHVNDTARTYDEDLESIKDRLIREYPSAESAIEDYRKGYITDEQLRLRFSQEEINLIHSEKEERDKEDTEIPTGFQ